MTSLEWLPLEQELQRWSDQGRAPSFWLRDDDAVEPTPALDRLLASSSSFQVPVTLAVIPAPSGEPLADRLRNDALVTAAVHGFAHINHAPPSEKKCELGLHRPQERVVEELAAGRNKLKTLHGERVIDVLVPPWNRIDSGLIDHLPGIGFKAMSVFGPSQGATFPTINANVDIIDWHGTRGCLDTTVLVERIVAQLRRAFDGGDPVGVLTHHLVHDEAAWEFLDQLFRATGKAGSVWVDLPRLLGQKGS